MTFHKQLMLSVAALSLVSVNTFALAGGQWQYYGQGKDPLAFSEPDHWAAHYPACGGVSQSPIDITALPSVSTPGPVDLTGIYYKGKYAIAENNGHTVQVNPDRTLTLVDAATGKETSYRLLQFHFHTLTEHTFWGHHGKNPGDRYMEMHFVNQATDGSGKLTVLAVLIQPTTEENKELVKLFKEFPLAHEEALTVLADSYEGLLPLNKSFFSYSGSLTTPPCSEIVQWIVFHDPIQMSTRQVESFRNLFANPTGVLFDTNRPTQPLNGRTVSNTLVLTPPED